MKKMQYSNNLLYALLIAGGALFASCGTGQNTNTDSTGMDNMDTASMMPPDGGEMRDTAPGAEMPPGAVNPGEDSSRYGTGTMDSSKDRRP